jgi:hypothetical protein
MGRHPRFCSFLPLSIYDDISGVCGCASYWEPKNKQKDKTSAGMSCSSHDPFLGALAMLLSVFSVQDGEMERVLNPLSPLWVMGNEGSAALRVHSQAYGQNQCQRSQRLGSRTTELPLRAAAAAATAAADADDDNDNDDDTGHVTAAEALRIARHMAKTSDPDRPRITNDKLKEMLAYNHAALEERDNRKRLKRRAKRRQARIKRVRAFQEMEYIERLRAAGGRPHVLVDYELPAGEERLEWDTDLVRRTFGEIE